MRCFLAIELPDSIRRKLADLQRRLAAVDACMRWVKPEQIHITLKFLGAVPDSQVAEACDVAARLARDFGPFELRVSGTGCFPPSGAARVIWAGLADIPEPLMQCYRRCEEAYAALGYPPENRGFKPHLTLGRVREGASARRVRESVRQCESFDGGGFVAGELVMFQSILGPSGAKYVPLARLPLSGQ